MKTIVLTGGGTAGHVTPNLALLQELKKNNYNIHYIGSSGIEKELIKKHPYVTYHEITTVKLIRSLSLKNLAIPFKLIKGVTQSKKLLQTIKPSIIFSKGGFVSVPVTYAASLLKIPVITHESDLTLGLANKLILKHTKVMCCAFETTVQQCRNKGIYTGTPIRKDLFNGDREKAYKQAGFITHKPTILFMGGSQGSVAINKVVLQSLKDLTKKYNIIHLVGKNNLSTTKCAGYFQVEYVDNIGDFLALSDIVVTRAGSNTINELLALSKPMILIPLPKTQSRGDQLLNAQEFYKHNYCKILYQHELNPDSLAKVIALSLKQKQQIITNLEQSVTQNATKTIINLINHYALK